MFRPDYRQAIRPLNGIGIIARAPFAAAATSVKRNETVGRRHLLKH
jgi:hypothetical protein